MSDLKNYTSVTCVERKLDCVAIHSDQSPNNDQATGSPFPDSPLKSFNMYGYRPSLVLPDDENYMDMVLILTRSSMLLQGSMGCVIVQHDKKITCNSQDEDDTDKQLRLENRLYGSIISAAINTALYKENESDVHAEIGALGMAARQGLRTENSTAYITMPPCKNCFGALISAGVKRVVSRQRFSNVILAAAQRVGVEMCDLSATADEQRSRVDIYVNKGEKSLEEMEAISEARRKRKQDRRKKKVIQNT